MGRPKTVDKLKRSSKITFRVSKDEQDQLERAAKISGVATGQFIRMKLLKGKFPEPKIAKVDLQTYTELKKIGVNLNQIARQVNAGKVPIGILAYLEKLISLQERIIRILV